MNGAPVMFSNEPLTIPASPDPENVASRAALKKSPCPAPLFDNEPADCDDSETASVSERISIAEEPKFLIMPFAAPEVRIGYRISKKIVVDFGVTFMVLLPPEYIRTGKPKGDEFSNLNRTEGQRRERLSDVPDAYQTPSTTARPGVISLDREKGLGIVMAIMPTFAGHFDF